jgi:pimeloyl-ACP methyl ester carboxylesterase
VIGNSVQRFLRPASAIAAAGLLAALVAPVTASAAAARPAGASRPPGASASASADSPVVPVLDWHSCDDGFQCATARVPLDYRQPHGATISIAVIRHLATDPVERIGSLFFNGGGPSEQLASFPGGYLEFPAALQERFDIVTFDPRGFGYSTAVRCFPSQAAEAQFLSALPPFPVGPKQIAAWDKTYARFDALCAERNGSLLGHDTTADVARDMNLLREAVGDPVLNYVGLSYGSALGATYANLFPDTVGNMILDGNVNPAAWSIGTLPVFMRLHSGQASAAAMTAFLDLCGKATTADCAFSAGSPAATRAKWNTLLSRLRLHPVTIGSPSQIFTYADVVASVPLGTVADWQDGAARLQRLWLASAASTRAGTTSAAQLPPVYTGLEQNLAVLCSDTSNPRDVAAYTADAKLAYAQAGGFGLEWMWTTEPCADWPDGGAPDRYTGPWNRPTANTILLLGNTGDSALPYEDSVAMSRELARARLLTVEGYGHTEASNPSTCAVSYEVSYMLTGALPSAGTVCKENVTPFSAPSGT